MPLQGRSDCLSAYSAVGPYIAHNVTITTFEHIYIVARSVPLPQCVMLAMALVCSLSPLMAVGGIHNVALYVNADILLTAVSSWRPLSPGLPLLPPTQPGFHSIDQRNGRETGIGGVAHAGLQTPVCGQQAAHPGVQTERRRLSRRTSKDSGKTGKSSLK